MEIILISVFLGIIAVSEIIAVILNATNRHLAEELRTLERNCTAYAENAVIMNKRMMENETRYQKQVEAMTVKIIELTKALEEAKKEHAV